jgi:hypothetical protein
MLSGSLEVRTRISALNAELVRLFSRQLFEFLDLFQSPSVCRFKCQPYYRHLAALLALAGQVSEARCAAGAS